MSKKRVEFGADGIRGLAGEWPLVPAGAVRIGRALGRFAQEQVARSQRPDERPFVVIGRDTRPSGAELLHDVSAGLTEQGVDVIDLGVMTTPGVAFLTRRQQASLGVIVSASHSSFEYNGIKLVRSNGLRLQREEEMEVEHLIAGAVTGAIDDPDALGQKIDGRHLIELYVQDHVERCPAGSLAGLRVVLDCANGAAAWVAPEVFRQLRADVVAINCATDGISINYRSGSEHARTHPEDLAAEVRQHEAMYGFAFDGDGDRLVVVDADGRVFDGNDLLYVLATYHYARGLLRGSTVVTTRLANRGLEEALAREGIRTEYTGKGSKNLEAAMWSGDYLLGGEIGGNVNINDGHHTAADAVYTALALGGVLMQMGALRKLAAPLRKCPQEIVSFRVLRSLTPEQREELEKDVDHVRERLGKGGRVLFWESSTEPGICRVMVEGASRVTAEKVTKAADDVRRLVEGVVGSPGKAEDE